MGLEPEDVAESVTRCVATGVAGLSIEDATGDSSSPLYDLPIAVERVRAARQAIDQSGEDVLLTARAECYHVGHPDPFRESVRRLQAYVAAGADVLFAPGPQTPAEIEALVAAVAPRPLNLLVVRDIGLRVEEIAALGVRRISVGGALALAAWTGFMRAAQTLKSEGSFAGLASLVPYAEINGLFATDLPGHQAHTRARRDVIEQPLRGRMSREALDRAYGGEPVELESERAISARSDRSTMSGADPRVSIRTTSATSPTRAQDTADSDRLGVSAASAV